jgi:hypothetical protein
MAKEKAAQFEQACVNYIKAQMILSYLNLRNGRHD